MASCRRVHTIHGGNEMKAEETVHATADELRRLLGEAEEALAGAGEAADQRVRELRERMREALDGGRKRARNSHESAVESFRRHDDYLHVHPYHALGAALAIG